MRFLTKAETAARVRYHPEALMRLVRQGRFPKPVRLAATKLVWPEAEIESWQEARVADRDIPEEGKP